MNILYASDDNYAEIAAISIVSLLENNRDAGGIRIFILDNGLSEESKSRLSGMVGKYSQEIVFIPIPDIEALVGAKLYVGCWALPIFARLFAASWLPADVDKIIYLDCDTLVRGSLAPLWDVNMDGYLIGGCEDGIDVAHKKEVFLEETDIYINSGMMLINLKAWRDEGAEKKYIDFLLKHNGSLFYPDQDVVNVVSNGRIKLVPPKFNSMPFYFVYNPELLLDANITDYYSQAELNEARDSPVTVHFAGAGRKPWVNGSENVYKGEYMQYRGMTPWRDMPLREPELPAE